MSERKLLWTIAVLCCLSASTLGVCSAEPQDVSGTIEGIVRDRSSGRGLPGVPIALTGPARTNTTTTDDQGRFAFRGLPVASYTLRALPEGYVGASTANVLGVVAARATVTPTQPSHVVNMDFIPASSISGRIRAPDGDLLKGVSVSPMLLVYQDGYPVLDRVPIFSATDERGEYRLGALPPGEYYVRADSTGAQLPGGDTKPARFTYFPGTDATSAAPVVLGETEDLRGIDFSLAPSGPTATISGNVVIEAPGECLGRDGRAIPRFYLADRNTLSPDRWFNIPNALGGEPATADNAPFELRDVPRGAWDLHAYCTGSFMLVSRLSIDVDDEDIEKLVIPVRPRLELKGRVSIDNTLPLRIENLRVALTMADSLPASLAFNNRRPRPAEVSSAGAFVISDLLPVRYSVEVTGLPSGLYLERVTSGPEVSPSGIVRIDNRAMPLELTIGSGAVAVRGRVLSRTKLPFAGASVVLIPLSARRENPALYKRAVAGSNGEFSFVNVPPGEYKLFAWEEAPPGRAEESLHFMSAYEHLGKQIAVRADVAPAPIELDVISNREW